MFRLHTVLFFPFVVVVLAACQRKEQPVPAKAAVAHSQETRKESRLLMPDYVKGKWKAVKIVVTDKAAAKQVAYTVPVGGRLKLPASSMTIEVEAFLPAFVMEGTTITSASNELKNPGAKVKISENDTVVFNGWLFSLFPKTHAFMHPRYGFALVDVIPAAKHP